MSDYNDNVEALDPQEHELWCQFAAAALTGFVMEACRRGDASYVEGASVAALYADELVKEARGRAA